MAAFALFLARFWPVLTRPRVDGKPERQEGEKRDFGYNAVSPDYFPAMSMEITRGRNLDDSSALGGPETTV